MSDRAAFLRHIAEHPHADLPRLVFADWLDERDDPLGLFIRVQIELDPIRDQIELPRVRELLEVEDQLLRENRAKWLEPAQDLNPYQATGPLFRRGLPHAVCLSADTIRDDGERWMEAFPTIRELAITGLQYASHRAANHPILHRLDVVEIADIPRPEHFAHFIRSEAFSRVPVIRLWNAYFGTCPLFGITANQWKPSGTVEYVQLLGGVMTGQDRDFFDQEADECAAEFNAVWGETAVKVVRPYRRPFSIHELEDSFPCGRFPDGRSGMVFFSGREEQVSVATFEGMQHIGTTYHTPPNVSGWDHFTSWLRTELQLSPASIQIRQFRTERMYGVQLWPESWAAQMERDRFTQWAAAWKWLFNGGYAFEGLGGHWADHRGFVHTS